MSKEYKGLLSPEMEEMIATMLDDKIKLSGILELVDGAAFKLVISQLDNNFGEKIQEPYKTQIREILVLVFEEGDRAEAVRKGFEALDLIVNLPLFDDANEAMIFRGFAEIVIAILINLNIIEDEQS